MLFSIQPGWMVWRLQGFRLDSDPRVGVQDRVKRWGKPNADGVAILHQGLLLATQEYPLPFVRRTILEFVLPGDEGLAWWEGLTGLCAGFGLHVSYLDQAGIEALARWVLNPNLDYQHSWDALR